MHPPLVTLLIFSAIYVYAEEISTSIPDAAEESVLRVRSLPMTINVVEKNWTSLSEMLDIFSARNLVRNWIEGKYPVRVQCGKDITTYINALKNEELWALKGKFTLSICSLLLLFYSSIKLIIKVIILILILNFQKLIDVSPPCK